MLATLADKPFDSDGWIYEIKWDGYRAISEIKNDRINIYSRNDISFNEQFAPIARSLEKMRLGSALLDGEIVVLDGNGRSRFQLLQDYLRTGKGILVYYVFDLIYLDGYYLAGIGLDLRKRLLKEIFKDNKYIASGLIKNIRISDHIENSGIDFFNAAVKNGLEGIVAKKGVSIYEPGIRSRNWLKIKIKQIQEVIICGYTENKKSRNKIGSLITGIFKEGELLFSGLVGGGLDQKERNDLYLKLAAIKTDRSPFKTTPKITSAAHWVKPLYVIQVEFAEWTADGLMRQPVYAGLRMDKSTDEVVFEKKFKIGVREMSKKPEKNNNISNSNIISSRINNDNIKKDSASREARSRVELTNPQKVFWPEENITKKDLFEYYEKISPYILPYIANKLQSLNRCPDGIYGECFYQKDIDYRLPEWLHTKQIYPESKKEPVNYLVCTGLDSLLYMVNLGCIDIHPWSSRVASIDKPDFAILDLDPLDVSFKEVMEVARRAKQVMDDADIPGFCKTSGSKGIHIYIPLGARYSYEQALDFTKIVAKIINIRIPEITSFERHPDKRHNKVYLDCYQNKIGATVAAPYCIRPKKGAPVSTPLAWEELSGNVKPQDFNIKTIFPRLKSIGDIWKGVMGPPIHMAGCIDKIRRSYKELL